MAQLRSNAILVWERAFAGHPIRIAAAVTALALAVAVAWYLGSPLFLTTYAEEALPTGPVGAQATAAGTGAITAPGSVGRVLAAGKLEVVDRLHSGRGPVKIVEIEGRRFVRFEDVAIQNGPDLHVYLSPDTGGRFADSTSVYLGALKATNGSFNYELRPDLDLSRYRSVVVWCRAFAALFTWADLALQ